LNQCGEGITPEFVLSTYTVNEEQIGAITSSGYTATSGGTTLMEIKDFESLYSTPSVLSYLYFKVKIENIRKGS